MARRTVRQVTTGGAGSYCPSPLPHPYMVRCEHCKTKQPHAASNCKNCGAPL